MDDSKQLNFQSESTTDTTFQFCTIIIIKISVSANDNYDN